MVFNPNRRYIRHGATLLVACASFSNSALAQNAFTQQIVPIPQFAPQKTHRIRVQNVPPRLMAWWLDPARQSEPVQLQSSRTNRENNPLLAEKASPIREIPALPAGIERLVAIDSQNTLLVFGTDAAVATLEKIVASLDQPLRQVEIEFEVLQISPQDAAQLGVSFSSDPKKRYSSLTLGVGALTRLAQLKAANQTKVISAPRILAINGLTAALGTGNGAGVVVDISTRATKTEKAVVLSGAEGQNIGAATRTTFTATPAINADDSITLELAPARILELSLPQGSSPKSAAKAGQELTRVPAENEVVFARRALEGARVETTVQDGQTIALAGFTSRLFGHFLEDAQKPASNVLILVKTRLVRRAEEDKAKTISLTR